MNEPIIEALRSGTLELDCNDMCLTQNATKEPRVFRGPGQIRQGPAGELLFTIYPREVQRFDPYRDPHQGFMPGRLVSDDEFYALTASDATGRTWACDRVMIHPSISFVTQQPVVIVRGDLYKLTSSEKVKLKDAAPVLKLHYFGEHEVPCNASTVIETRIANHRQKRSSSLDLASFTSGECGFLISRHGEMFTVETWSQKVLPPHFDQRITEALQFVMAKPLQWRVLEREEGETKEIHITAPQPAARGCRLRPPIHLGAPNARYWTWVLFDRYLQFILRHKEDSWHPCSVHLASVCEASAGSFDAENLALGVAIEGLAKTLFRNIAQVPSNFKTLVGELCTHIGEWLKDNERAKEANLERRLGGFRGQLLAVRAADRLHQLEKDGVIEGRHIEAWKSLRNAAAHAAQPGSKAWQELLDRKDLVVALLYRMVLHAISYEGRFSDYGSEGWPVAQVPVCPVVEEQTEGKAAFKTHAFERDLQWSGPPEGEWQWQTARAGASEGTGTAKSKDEAERAARAAAERRRITDVVGEAYGPRA